MDELSFIEKFGVLKIEPGDIVVLKHPHRLSFEAHERLRKVFKDLVNAKVIILEDGMDIGVLKEKINDGIHTATINATDAEDFERMVKGKINE